GCGGDLWRQRLWIVDDRTAYRPHANGVIWIWETSTGRLFVKIVHRTTWAGQTRRAQLAKWKCAEHVLTMLRSQPTEELPRGIVLAQTASMDPLKTLLAGTEYAKIPVRAGAAAMPLQALMALPEIRDRTQTARSSELSIWSGYADWLEHVPVWIASARFLLLLHALDRAPERVLQLVWPQRSADEESAGSATPWLWPALPETDWRRLELELQSLVPVR
nr:Chain A, Pre-mRNA splicing factor PRP8 [Cyanidioschyzon merolae strain 10D]6NQI_B Chain B, Pre-mRNA splicing factor PRP8 [Cyanidioschyzon merolae strain 10D]